MEGFDESSRLENANLSEYYLMVVNRQWLKFDEKAHGIIECQNLLKFLGLIKLPWDEEDGEETTEKKKPKDKSKEKPNVLVSNMHLPIIDLGELIEDTERPKVYFLF